MGATKAAAVGLVAAILAYAGIHVLNRGTDTSKTVPKSGAPRPPGEDSNPFETPAAPSWNTADFITAVNKCSFSGESADCLALDQYRSPFVAFNSTSLNCLRLQGWKLTETSSTDANFRYFLVSRP